MVENARSMLLKLHQTAACTAVITELRSAGQPYAIRFNIYHWCHHRVLRSIVECLESLCRSNKEENDPIADYYLMILLTLTVFTESADCEPRA